MSRPEHSVACERTALNHVRVYEDYDKRLRDGEQVTPLTSSVFGDEVSLNNGATSFSVVDVALPGNNVIPVELRRTFTVESKRGPTPLSGFGSWDIDVPYLVGVFDSQGILTPNLLSDDYLWHLGGNGVTNRCSQLWYPKVSGGLNLNDVWSGTQFHLPGKGPSASGHGAPDATDRFGSNFPCCDHRPTSNTRSTRRTAAGERTVPRVLAAPGAAEAATSKQEPKWRGSWQSSSTGVRVVRRSRHSRHDEHG